MKRGLIIVLTAFSLLLTSCTDPMADSSLKTAAETNIEISSEGTAAMKEIPEVTLITIDPAHFHAALVQKTMYPQINPDVYVYAPKGEDVQDHLNRIKNYNTRQDAPTGWNEIVYTGEDYLQKALAEKKGNVAVLAGNNRKKTEYIKACVDAGINVFSDKPMCVNAEGFELLKQAFEFAKKNNVLLYDIMTERYEITTMLQKELAHMPQIFGELKAGSIEDPSIVKESVHHFFKYVSGNPLKRPTWYFDTTQQGEGIVDVTTHLVDLVQWEAFPEQSLNYQKDVKVLDAKRWPTMITKEQYQKVTQASDFPDYLKSKLDAHGVLPCYANGQIDYTLKGIHARVKVLWNYEAPEGAKDTHYSIMKGTQANIIIRQGKEQNYQPELSIEPAEGANIDQLSAAIFKANLDLMRKYPGVRLFKDGDKWNVMIPDRYRNGHEAHFAQVTEKYLQFLKEGKMPAWEVPNMIAKYYTTTKALDMAMVK